MCLILQLDQRKDEDVKDSGYLEITSCVLFYLLVPLLDFLTELHPSLLAKPIEARTQLRIGR